MASGIAGVLSPRPQPELEGLARRMVAALRHDPAMASGELIEPSLGVYAGWVASPHGDAARICSGADAGPVSALLAGELYGDDEAALDPASGWRAEGEAALAHFNGLYSGLVVDRTRRVATLFNDRFGVERLYVHDDGERVWFASQAKALLAVLPRLRAFDDRGVADWLAFGSVLEGRTLFRDIHLLPGGSRWTLAAPQARIEKSRSFVPAQWESLPVLGDDAFCDALADLLPRVLPRYLRTPRSVGISLTGGLDTRMIMACLPAHAKPAVAHTYADRRGDTLDVRVARRVAEACAIEHRTLRLPDGFAQEFARGAERTVWLSDGCAALMSHHESLLSRHAAALAPIRLTGNYGSEVLRSVSTFKPVSLQTDRLQPELQPLLDAAIAEQRDRRVHPVTHAAFREIPWHLYGTLAAAKPHLQFRTPYLDNELVKLAYQASPAMRTSALPSLRLIARHHPTLAAIATDRGLKAGDGALRARLRRAGPDLSFKLDYWHMEGMPGRLSALDGCVDALARTGWFAKHKFLPYRSWLRGELRGWLLDAAQRADARRLPYWRPGAASALAEEHVRGRHNRLRELNALLTLAAVDRLLIHGDYRERDASREQRERMRA